MEQYLTLIEKVPLFAGIPKNKITDVLSALKARVRSFEKGRTIFGEGDAVTEAGIVLSGKVDILKEDYHGNRNLISVLNEGELFGEALCCTEAEIQPFEIVASVNSLILLFECKTVMEDTSFEYYGQFMRNLLQEIAEKNLTLRRKITLLSKRTTREKIMEFVLSESKRAGGSEFDIPYDRQQLADFLGVDRSAMSVEISKLRADGVISARKNHFKIL